MATDYDVVISGGGPVGIGLAIELGQRGHRVAVVERYPTPQPIPKGQNLTQRTMEAFRAWGCEDRIRAARTVPQGEGIGGVTCYGTLLSDYHYDWLRRELVRPFYATENERLPQYQTEHVLRARAAELASVELLYGWAVTGLDQAPDRVTVRMAEHGGTETRTVTARFLAGCDGSHSVVRQSAGITQTLSDHDRRMVLLVFRSTELHDMLARYPGKAFFNVLHPDLKGYWLFFGRVDLGTTWFFHAPVPMDTTADNYDFPALLHRAAGREFAVEIEHVGFWDLRFAIADTYRRGRVFVAGDAAHSHPPYGGYGINTGFEDARNLGWKLSAVLEGWGGPALLDSYHHERHPVFASTASDFIENFIHEDRAFLERYAPDRDRAEFERAWAARSEVSSEVSAYEPHYDGSPVVWGAPGATSGAAGRHMFEARAGHHLAPQPLSADGTTFDRLGTGFTLLALGAPDGVAEAFRAAARVRGIPLDIVADSAQDGRDRYAAKLILVRPDEYVAWCGDDAADPAAILSRACGYG